MRVHTGGRGEGEREERDRDTERIQRANKRKGIEEKNKNWEKNSEGRTN